MTDAAPLLDVRQLSVEFDTRSGWLAGSQSVVRAVQGVSLSLSEGETLGIVGESGCGKTTTGHAIFRMLPASGGSIRFMGQDISDYSQAQMRPLRRQMQIVYQDPFGSMNPRMRASDIVTEPMQVHGLLQSRAQRLHAARELLEVVGLSPDAADRHPHEFSGGQRQRLAIARAISVRPKLLLCDEPVSALDVSIQAQILNLFLDLKTRFGLSYLFVSHDLAVVRHVSDRVAVMYLGRVVESAPRDTLYREPMHPYTRALLGSVATPDPQAERASAYQPPKGEVPSNIRPPSGCAFHPRCDHATQRCTTERPELRSLGYARVVACHLHDAVSTPVAQTNAV